MSLPRTMQADWDWPQYSQTLGPFFVNGAVYIVGIDIDGGASTVHCQMWKSTDPDTTAFTIQDIDQAVLRTGATSGTGGNIDAYVTGDIIHVATTCQNFAWDIILNYFRFDTSTDLWDDGHGAWGTVIAAWGGNPVARAKCGIRVHTVSSAENIVIAYNGDEEKDMGQAKARVYIAVGTTSGWTVDITWDNSPATAGLDYVLRGHAEANDRIHSVVDAVGSELNISTRTASGTPNPWTGTAVTFTVGSEEERYVGGGASWDDGGTYRVRVPTHCQFSTASGSPTVEFDSADSGGTLTLNTVCDNVLDPNADAFTIDGTDLYRFYVHDTDVDLYYDKNDGSDTLLLTGTVFKISAGLHSYTVGGRNVVGYIYDDDAGVEAYDEISLAAPSFVFPIGSLALMGVGK